MLGSWIELMPLFVVRWISLRYCEQITQGGVLFYSARPDCYFTQAAQRAAAHARMDGKP